MNVAVAVLLVAAMTLALAWWSKRTIPATRQRRCSERYSPFVGVSRTYKQRRVAVPQELATDVSPLSPWLARAVDVSKEREEPTAGEAVPYDAEEVKDVMRGVVERINRRSPLDLSLLSVDGVRKTVDRYKNLRYEASLTAYSKTKNVGSKLGVVVEVTPDGRELVKSLRVQNAARDNSSGISACNDIGTEEKYAAFQPAVKY